MRDAVLSEPRGESWRIFAFLRAHRFLRGPRPVALVVAKST